MWPSHRSPALLLALLLVATGPWGCAPAGDPAAPNVVLVVVDTLRADHLVHHGYARNTSPRLARLAQDSLVFLDHQAHHSRTGPSVASLMTGLHGPSHGVRNPLDRFDGKGVLAEERLTLAELLREAGYDCRALVANPNLDAPYGFGQGFAEYRVVSMYAGDAALVDPAIGWLDGMGRPFFLYLHFMEPHSPYDAPARVRFTDPEYLGPFTGRHAELDRIVAGEARADPADRAHLTALYDQDIAAFDRELGRLLDALAGRGLLEQSVVVVVADHGEELFDHGSVLHGYTLYREQLHVPLVLHAPGRIVPGRVAATTRHVDVLPTLLELIGVPAPPGLQGRSLLPLARGQPDAPRPVFAETQLRAVRTVQARSYQAAGWKYVETLRPAGIDPELYHVAEDPAETRNLHATEPERAAALRAALERFVAGLPEVAAETTTLDPAALEALRALGYVESER